jgi:hypothetical protein
VPKTLKKCKKKNPSSSRLGNVNENEKEKEKEKKKKSRPNTRVVRERK